MSERYQLWLLIFALLAFGCPVGAFGQAEKYLVDRLREFEQQHWGLNCQYFTKTKGFNRDRTFWISQSGDGHFFRSGIDMLQIREGVANRRSVSEVIQVPNQRVSALVDYDDGEALESVPELRGILDSRRLPLAIGGAIFGVSSYDGLRFSDLATQENTRLSHRKEALDGEKVNVLVMRSKEIGLFEFYFSMLDPVLIRKIVIVKDSDSLVWDPVANEQVSLSEPRANANGYAVRKKEIWFPITYDQHDGKPHVSGAQYVLQVDHDGGRTELACEFIVEEVSKFSVSDSSRSEFERLPVKDGVSVYVKGAEGLSYVFRDGRIERAHDAAGIKAIDGVRFREPKSNWRWYAGLVGALCLVAGIWFYSKRRQNTG